jgi:hypothetical protein
VAQDGEALDVEHRELPLVEREGGDAEPGEDARTRPENSSWCLGRALRLLRPGSTFYLLAQGFYIV